MKNLTQKEIKELQGCLLDIMREIDRIARKYQINYILFGGSLLGCIRHKGFIPWDDDLDIALTRNEYNKLRAACDKELKSKFFWQDKFTDKNYPLDIAKIRYNDTLFIEERLADLDMHHGIFLDVFPMDNVLKPIQKPHARIVRCLQDIKKSKFSMPHYGSRFEIFIRQKPISTLIKLIPLSILNFLIDFSVELLNPLRTKYVNQLSHFGLSKPIISTGVFSNITEAMFEGQNFLIPKDYENYLSQKYGDYLDLPPEHKRKPTHNIIHLNISS